MRRNIPLWRFQVQRARARQRGIGWELSFEQWWAIWQESGHWEQRGRSVGCYVMARNGDVGPYAVGNVAIILATKNISDGNRLVRDLPRGVYRLKGGRFRALRSFGGRLIHLGCYRTPEEAREAYLRAA